MKVWVDCTAAAHPLVLRPVIDGLRERGHEVEITAREYGQTVGILERLGLEHTVVGTHSEGSTVAKGAATASRSIELLRWARPRRFDLAVAHGSVDIAVVSAPLRVPTAQMQDYEYAGLQRRISWGIAKRVLVPDAIPVERLTAAGAKERKLVRYPGLKEDYYLTGFEPDEAVMSELGLDRSRVIVVMRPPPESSAYGSANPLYDAVLDRVGAHGNATSVVIPRTDGQRQAAIERARRGEPVVVPERAIDAQSLIAFADLVVSAGGTMNREAVALGTPVYTIFGGRMGAVDEALIAEGMLRPLDDPQSLELGKRSHPAGVQNPRDAGILVDGVLAAALVHRR
jgi:predicted glycosyltransferase